VHNLKQRSACVIRIYGVPGETCTYASSNTSNRKNKFNISIQSGLGCALTFASEAKFEIEAKISLGREKKT
jgi:hypothetical protein